MPTVKRAKKAAAVVPASNKEARKKLDAEARAVRKQKRDTIDRIHQQFRAREELLPVAAQWVMAIRQRLALVYQEVDGFASAANESDSLLAGIFDREKLARVCRLLDEADCAVMDMKVRDDMLMPMPNPIAYAESLPARYPALASKEPT